uniref:Protein kinase domain-containing protein n=1 Tax=Acrobeloides nanus TaxID=290746 RepID=A0A914CYE0_9BILA
MYNGIILETSEIYFTLIYASKGYQLHNILIDFEDKPDGVSQGRVCKINLEGTEELFFVKCHHNGPRPSQSQYSNSGAPDVRELFVYKVFELLNILGNVYFFVPSNGRPWDLFIATEGVKNLNLFGDLKKEVNLPALAFIELLQFVLQLRDVGTNLSNCGQTEDGKPVIVDFSIPDYQEDFVLNAEDIMAYLAAKEYSQLARRQE